MAHYAGSYRDEAFQGRLMDAVQAQVFISLGRSDLPGQSPVVRAAAIKGAQLMMDARSLPQRAPELVLLRQCGTATSMTRFLNRLLSAAIETRLPPMASELEKR